MGQRSVILLVAALLIPLESRISVADETPPDAPSHRSGGRTFASQGLSKALGTDTGEAEAATFAAIGRVVSTNRLSRPGDWGSHEPDARRQPHHGHSLPSGSLQSLAAATTTVVQPTAATAPQSAPPEVSASPALKPTVPANPVTGPAAPWPKTIPEAKAEAEAKIHPQAIATQWPQAEIDLAHARCTALLKGLDVVTIPEASMRQGACGAPAPVRLISIGRNPEVALSPPPVVTCDMVVAMHTWIKSNLQPLAKKHLGAPIIKIETMSDYSCRNAYGRTSSRLSEHGRANALDIRGFTTARGDATVLLEHWGPTERDILAQIAAARASAEKLAQEKAAAEKAAQIAGSGTTGKSGAATNALTATRGAPDPSPLGSALRDGAATLTEALPRVTVTVPGIGISQQRPRDGTAFSDPPNRLAGPKAAPSRAVPAAVPVKSGSAERDLISGKSRFLREAQTSACMIFGTTLGPEANNAHRNHFHVDMAVRRNKNICE
ncbi:MAG: extensin [Hyphomicrobium sp.]|nr:MAG: extensin [Hyphomicrobium sp.]